MGKFISNLFLGALAVGLSIFTGSRTLDLLAWALPVGQTIYQWLGLAAFEGGMYFWSFYFLHGAKGTPQRSISVIMAVFSIVAVAVATVADLSLDAGESGKIAPLSPSMQQAMIVFLGVVIALNVAAFLACKLMSVEALRAIKEGQAEDLIYDEGLRAVAAVAPSIAADAAPHLAADWSNRVWRKIVPGVPRRTYLGPAPAAVPTLPAPAQPAPVVAPSQAPAKRKKLLGFIPLGGGSGKPAPATLAQTGAVEAPATAAPASAPAPGAAREYARRHFREMHAPALASQVAAARRSRRVARFQGQPHLNWGTQALPAPAAEPIPALDEHRTCSECGALLDLKNAKQLTCSPACRAKRARRLAAERQARKR